MKKDRGNFHENHSPITEKDIYEGICHHLRYTRCKNWGSATDFDKYLSLALTIRDLAVDRMINTQGAYLDHDVNRVYFFCMEYLLGKLLLNNIIALNVYGPVCKALKKLKLNLDTLIDIEPDAALGNGGLGRLAACYLDSMATMELPAYGYGIRYEHGMFRQELENGWQMERPDDWLKYIYPWEMIRPEYTIPVYVFGRLEMIPGSKREREPVWTDWQMFEGVPYDTPIIGYDNNTVNFLRLWSSRASQSFRLDVFNQGDYVHATQQKNWAETVTKVVYPSDNTSAGVALRLIQEHFLVSCSVRDLMRRFLKNHRDWKTFPEKNAIQLNDTHPSLTVAEMMRYFLDETDLDWDNAWDITTRTLGYTNHTILPEALEKWPVPLMEHILPMHLHIIYEINRRFLQKVEVRFPNDTDRIRRMSLIEESNPKQVRMANLAIVGSHSINGVSELHSQLLKDRVFPDFAQLYPERFNNKTNGVTQRRWLLACNHELSLLITQTIGNGWIKDLKQLRQLEPYATDPGFQKAFMDVKHQNKVKLAKYVRKITGEIIDPTSLFDVQIKRLHEYKRQLLNALRIITLYQRIKANPDLEVVPRTCIFGAKAAPNYTTAKYIIKLITSIADRVNHDPTVKDRLKVIFLPDYDVSMAEQIIPATDLSEQISTAGTEASGTGNMKLALNGAITIGTWDGANIEIAEEVGLDNIFIFGHRAEELVNLSSIYNPFEFYQSDIELKNTIDTLRGNEFCGDRPGLFNGLAQSLLENGDRYFCLADYRLYMDCQEIVDQAFQDKKAWARKAILNVARIGNFSSDRAIHQYAREIWKVKPFPIPDN